jgi:hypothetical protein
MSPRVLPFAGEVVLLKRLTENSATAMEPNLDFMNFEHSVPALNHIKVCMHRYGMCMPV